MSLARSRWAESGGAVEDSAGAGEVGGICTIKGFVAREGSGAAGRVLENPNSLASCLAGADVAGDRSSNERRPGGSIVVRSGGCLTFPVDTGFAGSFSGLLGGVLKGEIWSSDDTLSGRSGCGVKEFVSG